MKCWILSIIHTENWKLFTNLAFFDFESFCVKEETCKEIRTTKGTEKHVAISVSISLNLTLEPIFLCNSDPRHLVSSFISTLEGLATQNKAQMKLRFYELETAIKIKLSSILEQLNQRNSKRERIFDSSIMTTMSISTTLQKRWSCLLNSSKCRKTN